MRIECEKCGDIVDVTADSVSAPFWCNACEDVPPYASDADAIIADLKEQNERLLEEIALCDKRVTIYAKQAQKAEDARQEIEALWEEEKSHNGDLSDRYSQKYAGLITDAYEQEVVNLKSRIEDLELQLETAHSFEALYHTRLANYGNSLTDAENENLNLSLELVQARMDTEKMREALEEQAPAPPGGKAS